MNDGSLNYAEFWQVSAEMLAFANQNGYLTHVSPQWERVLGWSAEELTSEPYFSFVHPDDLDRTIAEAAALQNPGYETVSFSNRYRTKSGEYRWLAWQCRRSDRDDVLMAAARDVTAEVHERERRHLAERMFREATHQAPIGQALIGRDGQFLEVNPAYCTILGYSEDELLGQRLHDLTHPQDLPTNVALIEELVAGERQSFTMDKRYVSKSGAIVWVRKYASAVLDDLGEFRYMVAQIIDITEQVAAREAEQRALADLAYRSSHDLLTGLRNREEFLEVLEQALAHATGDASVALLYVDIDNFKEINDGISHSTGDAILAIFGDLLQSVVPERAVVGRLGGDEFAILLTSMQRGQEALDVAENVRVAVANETFVTTDLPVTISISIGVAVARAHMTPSQLLSDADAAMYQAKGRGKNRWAVAGQAMREEVSRRLRVATDIRQGLSHDEFRAWFQPVVDLANGTVVGHEALARWIRHGTVVPASEFIDVASVHGLLPRLGRVVMADAFAAIPRLPHPVDVNINCAPAELSRQDFVDRLMSTAAANGLSLSQINLEITEQELLSLAASTRRQLALLQEQGVDIYLDDFGTGYSSLATLREYPVTGVKLHQSFTADLVGPQSSEARKLARGIAMLAEGLGLVRIAEGVENREQQDALLDCGWPLAQGFLYSPAVPVEQLSQAESAIAGLWGESRSEAELV